MFSTLSFWTNYNRTFSAKANYGVLISIETVFLTRGATTIIIGKATAKANTQDLSQSVIKSSTQPKLKNVITKDIIKDIMNDITNAKTICWYR
jgi:phosphopantothenoylcysteine synthetase/decarboxylase